MIDSKTDLVATVKERHAAAETECRNLEQQMVRTQHFLSELQTKCLHAQGRRDALGELLKSVPPENEHAPPAPTP